MRKKVILSIIMGFSVLLAIAQKTDKIKYEGFYNNVKVLPINPNGYNLILSTTPMVRSVIDKAKLAPIKIKGVSEADDYTVIVYISDPVVTPSIETLTSTVNNVRIENYISRLSVKSTSKAIVLNKQRLQIYSFTAEPSTFYTQNDGMKQSSLVEAEKDLAKREKDDYVFSTGNYIQGLYKAYETQLNNSFGELCLAETFRINIIESKKFDYSEFNQASTDFQNATSTADVNNDGNKQRIEKAIEVWTKFAMEYQPDKKAKVSDENIDEIYFNIAMGYLALGNGEKLKVSWEKCQSIKGNYTQENYAMRYIPAMIDNYDNSLVAAQNTNKPMSRMSAELQFNNMIFLNGILNHYLSQKQGNLGVAMNYFPYNYEQVCRVSSVKTFAEGIKETYTIQYAPFGEIDQLKYKVEGGIEAKQPFSLRFENNEYGVSKVYKDNDYLLFSIIYKSNKISEVTYYPSSTQSHKFKFDYSIPNRIGIDLSVLEGAAPIESKANTFIVWNDKMQITSMSLNPFFYKEAQYDEKGNLVQLGALNAADESVTIHFTHQLDEKGNAIETINEGVTQKTEISYLF